MTDDEHAVSRKLMNRLSRLKQRRLIVVFSALCLLLVLTICLLDTYRYDISNVNVSKLYSWRLRGEQHPPSTHLSYEETVVRAMENTYIKHQYQEWLEAQEEKQNANGNFDLRPGSDFMQQQTLVQRKRKRALWEACRRHPELADVQLNKRNSRLLYATEKSRILYCVVPKAGCTNWKKVLMVLEGHRQFVWNITGFDAHKNNHLMNMSSMHPEEREQVLQTYHKFMYVRDPFVRLISAYRNKIARDMSHQGTVFRNYARHIVSKYRPGARLADLEDEGNYNVTWEEWIRYLTDPSEVNGFNHHWMEFYKICFPCKIHYDFIGNLETIAEDSAYLLRVLGLDRVSYPSSNATHSTEFYEQYYANVSREDLLRLWEIYRLDFELFGFAKPNVLQESDIPE